MKKRYGILSGIVVVALTILLYTLLVKDFFKIPMAIVALCLVLLSEVATTVALVGFKDGYKSVVTTAVLGAQTAITVVLSLLYINIFKTAFTGFILFYLLTFGIAVLLLLYVFLFRGESRAKDKVMNTARNNMLDIRNLANSILNSPEAAPYRAELKRLDENLLYSDRTVIADLDGDIYNMLLTLEARIGDDTFDVVGYIEEINAMIKQRNFEVKSKKAKR